MANNSTFELNERVIGQLSSLLQVVNTNKSFYNKLIADCKHLLKPWPAKKTSQTISNEPPLNPEPINTRSIPEFENANKLLARAEKARQRYSKNVEERRGPQRPGQSHTSRGPTTPEIPKVSDLNCNNNASSGRESGSDYEKRLAGDTQQGPSSRTSSTAGRRTTAPQRYVPVHRNAPFQTVTEVKRVKHGKTRAQSLREEALRKSEISGNKTTGSKTLSTGRSTQVTHSRSQVGGNRSQSTGSRPPVTGSRPHVASNVSHESTISQQHMARIQILSAETRNTLSSIDMESKSSDQHTVNSLRQSKSTSSLPSENVETHLDNPHIEQNCESQNTFSKFSQQNIPAANIQMQRQMKNSDVDNVSNELENLHIQDIKNDTESGVARFELLKHGSQLHLPAKYRKLCAQNTELRRSLRKRLHSRAVDANRVVNATEPLVGIPADHITAQGQAFLDRLDQHFSSLMSYKDYENSKRSVELADKYEKLQQSFHMVRKEFSPGDNWSDVAKKRRRMQHILSTYADLEDEYDRLQQTLPSVAGTTVSDEDNENCVHKMKTRNKTGLFWATNYFKHRVGLPGLSKSLAYSDWRQLSQLTTLLHEAQLNALRLQLCDDIAQLLPVVEQLLEAGENSAAPAWFRGLYSLLCHGGQVFPAMVLDSDDSTYHASSPDQLDF